MFALQRLTGRARAGLVAGTAALALALASCSGGTSVGGRARSRQAQAQHEPFGLAAALLLVLLLFSRGRDGLLLRAGSRPRVCTSTAGACGP